MHFLPPFEDVQQPTVEQAEGYFTERPVYPRQREGGMRTTSLPVSVGGGVEALSLMSGVRMERRSATSPQ
jgi:hypothetical protein